MSQENIISDLEKKELSDRELVRKAKTIIVLYGATGIHALHAVGKNANKYTSPTFEFSSIVGTASEIPPYLENQAGRQCLADAFPEKLVEFYPYKGKDPEIGKTYSLNPIDILTGHNPEEIYSQPLSGSSLHFPAGAADIEGKMSWIRGGAELAGRLGVEQGVELKGKLNPTLIQELQQKGLTLTYHFPADWITNCQIGSEQPSDMLDLVNMLSEDQKTSIPMIFHGRHYSALTKDLSPTADSLSPITAEQFLVDHHQQTNLLRQFQSATKAIVALENMDVYEYRTVDGITQPDRNLQLQHFSSPLQLIRVAKELGTEIVIDFDHLTHTIEALALQPDPSHDLITSLTPTEIEVAQLTGYIIRQGQPVMLHPDYRNDFFSAAASMFEKANTAHCMTPTTANNQKFTSQMYKTPTMHGPIAIHDLFLRKLVKTLVNNGTKNFTIEVEAGSRVPRRKTDNINIQAESYSNLLTILALDAQSNSPVSPYTHQELQNQFTAIYDYIKSLN